MLFFSAIFATALGARELTDDDFDKVIEGQAFVKFFAPWCGHCKNMKPAWDDLEAHLLDSPVVTIADVDCTGTGKNICQKIGVQGYPTVKYFIAGETFEYNGARGLSELKAFVATTFKSMCVPESGESCDDEQKEIIKHYKGKDVAAELIEVKKDMETQAVEFVNVEKEFKAVQDRLKKTVRLLELLAKSPEVAKDEL
eukprot:GEMP01057780.1.p1 GENE.GEMP01057780.1~~GEMP01057780.1.p1  ORF type:complete len:198 (+),score=59.36 GEMP01057780.1:68-661(+)